MNKGVKSIRENPNNFKHVLAIGVAELLGTAFLVFLGCMGCTTGLRHGSLSPLQPALVFGFAVIAILQMFGHISKAHINPAVTVAAVVLRVTTIKMAFVYIVAQCIGGVLGYGFLKAVTPEKALLEDSGEYGFCTTVPNSEITMLQAFLAEFLATSVLIFVLCASWDRRNATMHDSLSIKFGFTISCLALAVGPYTGGSMNPARSLGPAFWNGEWKHHWVYWVSPLLGSVATAFFYQFIFAEPEEVVDNDGAIPLNSNRNADVPDGNSTSCV